MPIHSPPRRAWLWGATGLLLAGGLAFVPLFDVLGYEFSFAVALFTSFGAADLGVTWARRARAGAVATAPSVLAVWRAAVVRNVVLLVLPPLAVILANSLRVPPCEPRYGLIFYALLPGLSVPLATTVGVVAELALGGRPRVARAAAWLFVAGSLAIGVARFYGAPPIFAYDPFAGYFPGALYDERLSITPALLWARLYHVAIAASVLAGCVAWWERPRRLRALAVLVLAGGAAVGVAVNAPRLGLAASSDDIARVLGGRIETEHFVIHYPRGAVFAPIMHVVAREHELRWAQVTRALGTVPTGKIRSFYFATAEEKQRWMGAATTYIAKPWRREIYVQHEDFPHDSLRHEIAHVVAGTFGDRLFGVSVSWLGWPPARFNVGLIEGVAVAADWPGRGRLTPHQAVRAMRAMDRLPPLRQLLAPGFLRFSSAQSYTTAGSFVYHLLQRHGAAKLRELYRAGGTPPDFEKIYGKPLDTLEAEWHAEVDAAPLAPEDLEVARERFRRHGIFARPCPHAIARRHARADELLAAGEPERAVAEREAICRNDPGEPTHWLALAQALERARRSDDAAEIYRALARRDAEPAAPATPAAVTPAPAPPASIAVDPRPPPAPSAPLRARALLELADLLGRRGDLDGARAAVALGLSLPVDEATRRNLRVRLLALADRPGAAELRGYLFAEGPDGRPPDPLVLLVRAQELAAATPGRGLGRYLTGRLLWQRGAYRDAARALADARRLGLDDELVAREADRLLAAAATLSGDLLLAQAAATRLADPANPPMVRAEGEDWLERVRAWSAAPP